MRSELRPAVLLVLLFTVITGGAYPLAVTGLARVFFPDRARGSVIMRGGRAVGSKLIGQPFTAPQYFWGRPSATSPYPYNAASSSGSNYGPLNPALLEAVAGRIAALRRADSEATGPVPVDLVTASGSGLDPGISPAAAEFQVARVARARGMDAEAVRRLVREHTQSRPWGFLGEPTVKLLELNLALDAATAPGPGGRNR